MLDGFHKLGLICISNIYIVCFLLDVLHKVDLTFISTIHHVK